MGFLKLVFGALLGLVIVGFMISVGGVMFVGAGVSGHEIWTTSFIVSE